MMMWNKGIYKILCDIKCLISGQGIGTGGTGGTVNVTVDNTDVVDAINNLPGKDCPNAVRVKTCEPIDVNVLNSLDLTPVTNLLTDIIDQLTSGINVTATQAGTWIVDVDNTTDLANEIAAALDGLNVNVLNFPNAVLDVNVTNTPLEVTIVNQPLKVEHTPQVILGRITLGDGTVVDGAKHYVYNEDRNTFSTYLTRLDDDSAVNGVFSAYEADIANLAGTTTTTEVCLVCEEEFEQVWTEMGITGAQTFAFPHGEIDTGTNFDPNQFNQALDEDGLPIPKEFTIDNSYSGDYAGKVGYVMRLEKSVESTEGNFFDGNGFCAIEMNRSVKNFRIRVSDTEAGEATKDYGKYKERFYVHVEDANGDDVVLDSDNFRIVGNGGDYVGNGMFVGKSREDLGEEHYVEFDFGDTAISTFEFYYTIEGEVNDLERSRIVLGNFSYTTDNGYPCTATRHMVHDEQGVEIGRYHSEINTGVVINGAVEKPKCCECDEKGIDVNIDLDEVVQAIHEAEKVVPIELCMDVPDTRFVMSSQTDAGVFLGDVGWGAYNFLQVDSVAFQPRGGAPLAVLNTSGSMAAGALVISGGQGAAPMEFARFLYDSLLTLAGSEIIPSFFYWSADENYNIYIDGEGFTDDTVLPYQLDGVYTLAGGTVDIESRPLTLETLPDKTIKVLKHIVYRGRVAIGSYLTTKTDVETRITGTPYECKGEMVNGDVVLDDASNQIDTEIVEVCIEFPREFIGYPNQFDNGNNVGSSGLASIVNLTVDKISYIDNNGSARSFDATTSSDPRRIIRANNVFTTTPDDFRRYIYEQLELLCTDNTLPHLRYWMCDPDSYTIFINPSAFTSSTIKPEQLNRMYVINEGSSNAIFSSEFIERRTDGEMEVVWQHIKHDRNKVVDWYLTMKDDPMTSVTGKIVKCPCCSGGGGSGNARTYLEIDADYSLTGNDIVVTFIRGKGRFRLDNGSWATLDANNHHSTEKMDGVIEVEPADGATYHISWS